MVKQCKSDMEPYVIFGCLPFTCTSNRSSADEGYQVLLGQQWSNRVFVGANMKSGQMGTIGFDS